MKEKYTNNTISTFSISFDTFSSDPSLPLYTMKTEHESPKNNNKILVLKPKYLQFSGAKNRIYKLANGYLLKRIFPYKMEV